MHAVGQRHADRVDARIVDDALQVRSRVGVSVAVGGPAGQLHVGIDHHGEVDVDDVESCRHGHVAVSERVGLTGGTGPDEGDPDLLSAVIVVSFSVGTFQFDSRRDPQVRARWF